jgi:hypothetical protein
LKNYGATLYKYPNNTKYMSNETYKNHENNNGKKSKSIEITFLGLLFSLFHYLFVEVQLDEIKSAINNYKNQISPLNNYGKKKYLTINNITKLRSEINYQSNKYATEKSQHLNKIEKSIEEANAREKALKNYKNEVSPINSDGKKKYLKIKNINKLRSEINYESNNYANNKEKYLNYIENFIKQAKASAKIKTKARKVFKKKAKQETKKVISNLILVSKQNKQKDKKYKKFAAKALKSASATAL